MEYERYCEVCGKPYAELHHIIFRSQAGYLTNVPVNFKYLCAEHHRGNNSPHRNRKIDLQYKRELQAKLEKLLNRDYYTIDQLKNTLDISKKEAEKVVNKTPLYKEGYAREDILKRLMGGRLYDE